MEMTACKLTETEAEEDIFSILDRSWKERERRCQELGHTDGKSRAFTYGYDQGHIVVVVLCDSCYKDGKKEHREMAHKFIEEAEESEEESDED